MPRRPRIDYPGAWQHVMHHATGTETLFRDDDDCVAFLGAVETASRRFHLEVHGYALIPNHYHLLVRSMTGDLSRGVGEINGRYSREYNHRYGRRGPLFRGRFRNQLVEEERYLVDVLAYIHLNPVRARLVKRPDEACWTSYRAYAGLEQVFDWLLTDELLEHFGGREPFAQHHLDLVTGRQTWPEDVQLDGEYLRLGDQQQRGSAPRAMAERRLAPVMDPQAVLARVTELTGASRRQLRTTRCGPGGNAPRRLAAWSLSLFTPLTHRAIGELLDLRVSNTSQLLSRIRRDPGETLAAWMAEWENTA